MIVGAGLVYGVTVTRRESAYLELIERGDGALGRDDSYAAIEAFTVAISLKGDSMPAHLKRGEAYRRRGEFESALRDLRRASELDPLATQPRELLGDVNYAMGGYARAVERYAEYIELDDRSPRLLYKSALASFYLGEVSVSITALKKALAIDDRFAEGHYLLGVCLREAQQSAELAAGQGSDSVHDRKDPHIAVHPAGSAARPALDRAETGEAACRQRTDVHLANSRRPQPTGHPRLRAVTGLSSMATSGASSFGPGDDRCRGREQLPRTPAG